MRRRQDQAVPSVLPEGQPDRPEPTEPFLLLRHLKGPSFFEDEIRINHGILGMGSQGQVYRMELDILGVCAVKLLAITQGRFGHGSSLDEEMNYHRQLAGNSVEGLLNVTNDTARELQFTQEVAHHPNIVGFYGYLRKRVNVRGVEKLLYSGLIMECMEGGSIGQVMTTNPPFLTEGRVVSYSLDIARALAACHTKYNIMHRDIKPSNVFLTADRRTAKLGDFGYAKKAECGLNTNKKGTIMYMAPELINEDTHINLVLYTFKPDIWSFAMFVYAMTFKRDPFSDDELVSTQNHRERLLRNERPNTSDWQMDIEGFKDEILDIIKEGWKTDPNERRNMKPTVQKLRKMADRIRSLGENM